MTHLTDRDLVELRDGVPLDADVRTHLEACAVCRDELATAETRADKVRQALGALDEPFDAEAAKQAVRVRLSAARPSARERARARWLGGGWSMGKAAALLLVAAGAASALPGSPVRGWLTAEPEAAQPQDGATATEAAAQIAEPVGGRLTVSGGPVSVVLDGVPAATSLQVRWVDGSAVTVRAAAGSSFSYGEGRVQAMVAGGPVTVELPRSLSRVSMVVNGRTYLTGSMADMALPGPVRERTDGTVVFTVPGG